MTSRDKKGEREAPALEIIGLFGGIRPMAHKLDVPVSTVQGWKERAAIPSNRHDEILAAAAKHNVDLPAELLKLSDQGGDAADDEAGDAESSPEEAGPEEAGAESLAATEGDEQVANGQDAERAEGQEPEEDPEKDPEPGLDAEGDRVAAADSSPGSVPPTALAPQPAKSGGGSLMGGIVLGAVILAVGAGIAVISRDVWLPIFGDPGASTAQVDISGLESRLASLENTGDKKIGSLEASVKQLSEDIKTAGQGSGVEEKALTDLGAEVDKLKARLNGLETASQAAPEVSKDDLSSLSGEQQSLASRLSGIEQEVGGVAELKQEVGRLTEKLTDIRRSANADGAILLAGLQLRDAVKGSGPFEAQYDALEALSAKDEKLSSIISPLQPYAATGVETLEELRASFPPVAAQVVAVERGSDAGDGWLSGAVRRIAEVVTVRPVGMVEGDAPGNAAARAEFYLNGGDLASAVKELDSLSPDAAAAAAGWKAKAEARLAVDQALGQVADLVADRLGKLGG